MFQQISHELILDAEEVQKIMEDKYGTRKQFLNYPSHLISEAVRFRYMIPPDIGFHYQEFIPAENPWKDKDRVRFFAAEPVKISRWTRFKQLLKGT